MKLWVFMFICLLVNVKNADCVARSNKKQDFSPLPEGKPYSLDKAEEDKWSLSGLSNIADGIALALRENPPYDIIGNVLSQSFGTGGKSPSISEVINYEVPLIVMASLSLLAALVIPIVGLIFCCCRCKGNCGGSIDDSELKVHPSKERIAYSVGILVCALFLILAGSFILASSARMTDTVPHVRTVWKDSFSDIQIYSHNTLKELNHIVAQEAIPMFVVLVEDVITMGQDIIVPILDQGGPVFEGLFQGVLECQQAILQSLFLFNEIQVTVSSLVSQSKNIQLELNKARKNLTAAKRDCDSDSSRSSACNDIPVGDKLTTEANFTKVPNVTDTHKKTEDVAKTNLTKEVVEGNKSVHSIPDKVQNLTTDLRKDFKNFSSKIENAQVDILDPLEDKIDEWIQHSLNPVRDDVDKKYLGPDGMVTKYDKYRHIIFILIGSLTLLDALLLVIAVILGMVGSSRYETPNSRSNLVDWGGRLMIGAAGLFFFSAFLVNLLAGIVFLLGSNVAIVCDDLPDYKLLRMTIDDPKVMGEYILSKSLFNDGSVPLTTSGILSDCSKNFAPWAAFKMNHVYNLSDELNYKEKIPSINEVFAELNKTIADTSVLSLKASATVNDSLEAGVHQINFTQYHEQVDKPIVSVPLTPFAANVSSAANTLTSVSQKASDQLKATADSLELVQNTAVKSAKQQADRLRQLVNQLEHQGNAIMNSYSKVTTGLKDAENFLSNVAPSIAARGVVKHWDTVFGVVDYLLDGVIHQLRFEVGRCRAVSNIYRGLTSSLCSHYAAGMNASWVAFGLCALVLLISIVLCVRASKHFRRTSGMEGSDEPGIFDHDEPLELPWMDGLGMEPSHVVDVKVVSEI